MEKLNKDELFNLALLLDLKDLSNLCRASKNINRLICENDAIWLAKLKQDYPDYQLEGTPRETYLIYDKLKMRTTKLPPVSSLGRGDPEKLRKLFL